MQIQCDYCGQFINDTDSVCPYCGGTNTHLKRTANNVPVTIEELKAFCISHNLPLAQMRFFIGENYTGARAFGIYKDEQSGNFIVYKNKSDGSRAIRYEGKDEAYAVNELYQKIKSEMTNQKQMRSAKRPVRPVSRPAHQSANAYRTIFLIIITIFILYVMIKGIQGLVYFGGFPYNCYNGYQPYTYSNWDSENNNSNWGDDWDDNDGWDDNSGWGNDWDDDGGWNDDSGWDNDWDSDWDYGSDWDSDWSDWDSDW